MGFGGKSPWEGYQHGLGPMRCLRGIRSKQKEEFLAANLAQLILKKVPPDKDLGQDFDLQFGAGAELMLINKSLPY